MAGDVKPTLIFFGNERLGTGVSTTAPTLQTLVQSGYKIGAVVVAQNETGPSRKTRKLEIEEVAEAHNIPVIAPKRLKEADTVKQLASYGAEAAVLVAYGKIVPKEILDIFPKGILNIHPSLLPKHRGPTPIESVILHNDNETGVSIMQLVLEMDAGPVYAQETLLLRGNEEKQVLADQLLEIGKNMLISYLPQILDGSLKPTKQNDKEASTDSLIKKSAAQLNFEEPAEKLERQVRAFAGWPRSKTVLGTTEVIITKAHPVDINGLPGTLWFGDQQIGVHAKEGTLMIDALIPAGKKEMTVSAFLSGYRPQV
jgi:methionyl-tRNA formyltransferase